MNGVFSEKNRECLPGKVCALTGHRELPCGFSRNDLTDLLEKVIRQGYDKFLCGMAQGFDLFALECLVYLKRKYRIGLEACIPYKGQERGFPTAEKEKYRALLGWCEEKTVLFDRYGSGCFLARNRYMVDRADAVVAYCQKTTGGTAYTVRYAEQRGIPVIFVGSALQTSESVLYK